MQHQKDRSQEGAHEVRRPWLPFAAVALVAVLLLVGQPLFAADAQPTINQTVPPATPRPTVENPNDDNNDDNDDNNNNNNNNSGSTDTGSATQPADAAAATSDVAQTAAVTSTTGLTATVNVLALNVRQGPSTTFPVVGKLTQNAIVGIEARNAAGDWLLVCCIPGTTTPGWVSASLVVPGFTADQGAVLPVSDGAVTAAPLAATTTPAAPAAVATPVPGSKPGVVAGVNLNVRQGPGTDNDVAGKLRANDTVSVLGRNATGDWLYICCIGDPPANGWVSAQFITPAFAAGDLPEVAAAAPVAPAPAATPTSEAGTTTQATGDTATAADAPAAAGGLSVSIAQQPPFAVQGREVALVYTVRNDGSADLVDVVLSSDLPGPLTLVGATAAGATVSQQDPAAVQITWPSLAAGESATATVRVRVAGDVPDGATFANLATVTAGDESVVNGITIGMPPALLPEFW